VTRATARRHWAARPVAALLLILAGLSACSTVPRTSAAASERRAPEERPVPEELPGPPEQSHAEKVKRYRGYVSREVIPLLPAEIRRIKQKGYLSAGIAPGLDHVHVRYRGLHPESWHHLHYHGMENAAATVAAWRRALRVVATGEMKHWLAANEAAQFDYGRFFYGDGGYEPAGPLPRAELKGYARRWWKTAAGNRGAVSRGAAGIRGAGARSLAPYVDRLIMVVGARQPGYEDAAARVLAGRSLVSLRGDATAAVDATGPPPAGPPVAVPADTRFLEGFYHPVTIYFEAGPRYRIKVLLPE